MSYQEDISKFIHVEGGRNLPNGRFTRNEMMLISDLAEFRKRTNNTGIYLSAYLYDNIDVKEANLYADFYLDFDSEEDFEKAREDAKQAIKFLGVKFKYNIPPELVRIYFSGKKGLHLTVPATVMGVQPHKHLNEFYKLMAKEVSDQTTYDTIDLKIYDRRRLFRVRNSRHHDTNLFKIPLTYDELYNLTLEEIKEKAQLPCIPNYVPAYEITRAKSEFTKHINDWHNRYAQKFDNRRKGNAKPLDFIPECIKELWESGPVKGQRNNSAAALVSFFKKQGRSEQETWERIVSWNNNSLGESELKAVLESVYKREYEYGCSTLETLATCVGEKCPIFKKDK